MTVQRKNTQKNRQWGTPDSKFYNEELGYMLMEFHAFNKALNVIPLNKWKHFELKAALNRILLVIFRHRGSMHSGTKIKAYPTSRSSLRHWSFIFLV